MIAFKCYVYYLKIVNYWNYAIHIEHKEENKWQPYIH